MKAIILYSQNTPSPDHHAVPVYGGHLHVTGGAFIYVRTEVVDADLLEALDMANPRPLETVLNTIEYPS